MEFERRQGVKPRHEEAQERKKDRQRSKDKKRGGGEEKVWRAKGSLSRDNITLKNYNK